MTTACKILDGKRRKSTRYGEKVTKRLTEDESGRPFITGTEALPHPYKKHMLPLCLEAENVDLPKGGKLLAIAWGNWYNKLILRKKDGEVPLCI